MCKAEEGITSLKWSRFPPNGQEDTLLPLALASCPQLDRLEVASCQNLSDTCIETVRQLTALQRLTLAREMWPQFLPYLAFFPSLKDIARFPFKAQDAVERIAALTTLTRVGADCAEGFALLEPLSRLSALQVLSLEPGWDRSGECSVEVQMRGVTQLTELAIYGGYISWRRLPQMVARIGRLRSLHLHWRPCRVRTLLETSLHGLRHFSVTLGVGTKSEFSALFSALTGLERLTLDLDIRPPISALFHLNQLTRLTGLRIAAPRNRPGSQDALCLTGLTGLVDLNLRNVLRANPASDDIAFLAALTKLQWLAVDSGGGECLGRKRIHVSSRDLQPFKALRMLEAWDLDKAWHWEGESPNDVVSHMLKFHEFSQWHRCCTYRLRWQGSAFTAPLDCPYSPGL